MEHIVMVPVERYLEMKCAEEKLHAAVEELKSMQTELNGVKRLAEMLAQLDDRKLVDDEDLSAVPFSNEELANRLRRCASDDGLCTGCPFVDYIEDESCVDMLMAAAADALDESTEL